MRLSFLKKNTPDIFIHSAHVWTLARVCTLLAELEVFKFQN